MSREDVELLNYAIEKGWTIHKKLVGDSFYSFEKDDFVIYRQIVGSDLEPIYLGWNKFDKLTGNIVEFDDLKTALESVPTTKGDDNE